jgi:hypothetical protein
MSSIGSNKSYLERMHEIRGFVRIILSKQEEIFVIGKHGLILLQALLRQTIIQMIGKDYI